MDTPDSSTPVIKSGVENSTRTKPLESTENGHATNAAGADEKLDCQQCDPEPVVCQPAAPVPPGSSDEKTREGDTDISQVKASCPKENDIETSLNKDSDAIASHPGHEFESSVAGHEIPVELQQSGEMSGDTPKLTVQEPTASDPLPNRNCNGLPTDVPADFAVPPVEPDILPSPAPTPTIAVSFGQPSGSSNTSSLSLLAAQYDTDSDSDDEVYEVPPTQTYQNRFVEIDSDSSSSLSDVEVLSGARSPIDLDFLEAGHGEEDDEGNVRNTRTPMVKGEFQIDDLPPIQNLHITVPEEECTELGKVQSIVEQLVLVNSLPGTVPLDLETVLFLDKGKQVLGEIFDVLGQVSDPLYCVRFNSNKQIREKGIQVGQTVYVAPRTQHTQFIVLANLMKVRGSDASWENDVEPPPKFLDYSDDEEERTARRSIRNRNRPSEADDEAPKRQRAGEPPFPNCGVYPPPRPYRGNYYEPAGRQPRYPHPSNYNIAGNSWHSNFYQNYPPLHQQHPQYRMPIHPATGYRAPLRNMLHRQPPGPPPTHSVPPPTHSVPPPIHSGLVINPYAVFPPPQLMQQPLFPPPPQQPPPPPPPPQQGGF